jgi:NAD(P)-dependent dehydrogenase (short-subunit alcohol dehydrogenase family)
MDLKLQGRSALITGASRGIGLAIARALGAEGCNLHLTARNESLLNEAAREIRAAHGVEVCVHPKDLTQSSDIEALGRACLDVDILVNNAGDIPTGTLQQLDGAAWRRGWELKVFGYIDLTRIILPHMYARRSGVVINVNGGAGEVPNSNYIAGCVGNAALNMFSFVLGGESVQHGVRVVAVNPGATMTDRHKSHLIERAERRFGDGARWPELMADYPSGRSGTAEEVAHAVAFLASDLASNISGTALRIDGGIWAAQRKH